MRAHSCRMRNASSVTNSATRPRQSTNFQEFLQLNDSFVERREAGVLGDRVGAAAPRSEAVDRRHARRAEEVRVAAACRGLAREPELVRSRTAPTVLTLPNVLHLATQVRAELEIEATSLQVAGALHPTAALGGTPTLRALDTIAEIEGIDRDRYGAPVGWMDTRGGEWCIALRCARIEGRQAIAWAGGGIMADSDPDAEYAETEAKLAPVLGALGG